MVVHIFPLAKLGALLLRQIIRAFHWVELKGKMWVLKMGKPVNISILNEKAAIELGAGIWSEIVLFSIAAGLLITEYNRSTNKEAEKEAMKTKEMNELRDVIRDLFIQSEQQRADIKSLTRKYHDLESKVILKPWMPKDEPEEDPDEPVRDPPPALEHPPDGEETDESSTDDSEPPKPPPSTLTDKPKPPKGPSPLHPITRFIEIQVLEPGSQKNKSSDMSKFQFRHNGLLLKAVNDLERQFLVDPNRERQEGILTVALNLFYRDVYKVPIRL